MNNDAQILDADVSIENTQSNDKQVALDSVINWQLPVLAILFVSVVFVAIKTVVHRHESRSAYMKLQVLEKERDKLAAQWSRLKLEQAVTLNQVRVEQYARWDLNMKMPKASEVKVIQEPRKESVNESIANISANEGQNIKVSNSMVVPATSAKVVLGN